MPVPFEVSPHFRINDPDLAWLESFMLIARPSFPLVRLSPLLSKIRLQLASND
jgi:hypothetical protein